MKKSILFILLIVIMQACGSEPQKEKVCLKLYLVSGRVIEASYMLPKGSVVYIVNSQGGYSVNYKHKDYWLSYTIRQGVNDFEIINCNK
jgi:hypothetical protein